MTTPHALTAEREALSRRMFVSFDSRVLALRLQNAAVVPGVMKVTMGELGKFPEPLQIIGKRYRVECCIASGAETSVVGAIDCATGKRVALKCWDGPTSEQEVAAVQCFVRSANVTGLFENPHVVEVFGTELGDTLSYSVTERLEGSTLAREVERLGRLSVREALSHILPCMRAVVEAHASGIIHGDIRPAHIFLSRAKRHLPERARLFDFGRGAPGFHELRLPARVEVDEFCRYTPPELLCGAALDARSDVYAFGLLLYEVMTGERIFPAEDLFDLLREIERGPKRAIGDVTQSLPRGLTEVLYRAMSVHPEERYQGLAIFLDELLPFADLQRTPVSASVVSQAQTDQPAFSRARSAWRAVRWPRRWHGLGSGAAMVTTVLGLGYLAIDNGPSDTSQSDNAVRPVTSHNAVRAEPSSPATPSEPVHDLIIPEPLQVTESAQAPDAHTQARRGRSRSERRRERPDTAPALEAPPAAPPTPVVNDSAAPQAQSPTPLERMQLQ
jgi:serine/threonine-protein kinase